MRTFSVEIGIGSRDRDEWVTLDALVDTGAFVTSAPVSLLCGLGVEPMRTQEFTLPNGETREMEIGQARVRVGGRHVTTLVLFNDEDSTSLLDALALEACSWKRTRCASGSCPSNG